MVHYLIQGSYTPSSVKAMIGNPQDRSAVVEALIRSAGGTFHHMFFGLGESDFYILCELPDNSAAAAVALVVGATGAIANYRTTALLTPGEAVQAMTKAKGLSYKMPGA